MRKSNSLFRRKNFSPTELLLCDLPSFAFVNLGSSMILDVPQRKQVATWYGLVREAIGYQIGCFFTHCVKGGSYPCVKIYVADLYNSGGLMTT